MIEAKFQLTVFNTQPPHLYFGGVERRIIETAKRIQKHADITIYSGTKGGFKQSTTIENISFVPCFSTDKNFPLDNWFFNRSLKNKTKQIEADIYEAHAVSGYQLPRTLQERCLNKPFVHTIHGVLADEYEQTQKWGYKSFRNQIANYFMKYQSKLEKEMAMNATLIVTISKYSSEKIQQHYDIDRNKITIVPNGVDTEKFKPTRNFESLKQQFGLTKGLNILFVGNLIPRKGLMFLIEAAKKIILNQTDAKFIIVGEGPQKSELQKNIRDFNLTKSFLFMGNLIERQLLALYDCADLFVLPSIQEGQGIVLLEAQSFGKPVVAFNIGGVNETVQNNKTGFLVDQDKPGALAEGINRLLIDSELRAKMGSNAREFVTENFTWNICAKKMLNVYSELLNKKH